MSSKKKNRANNHKNERVSAGMRGEDRIRHFADGGSIAEWRGQAATHKNKREKRNDRSTVQKKAIEDSKDE